MIYILLFGLVALSIGIVIYMNMPKFGRSARGERLSRIECSPNYRNGQFHNQELTLQITTDKNRARVMFDFLFEKRQDNRPDITIPTVKTDLKTLDEGEDLLVWFGHSSYFIQSSGKRILVDPVFEDASPVSFLNKPFPGTDIYKAHDMPDIDYLIITHDHWDHLDYQTVRALRNRVIKIICPLGVGEHLQYWGYTADQIIEMDWNENVCVDSGFEIYCLPSRHFSGRTLKANQTLWASYMVETPSQTIYLSGDGGYGKHFAEIARAFPRIDLAIIENGQYNKDWRYIHLMPEDLTKIIHVLKPGKIVAGHNGKYALSKHPWHEPLDNVAAITSDSTQIIMPMIGQLIKLQDSVGEVNRWWESSGN